MQRRFAALLALAPAFALAVVAGVAAPAAAQVPGLTATLSVPSTTSVGVSVQATAVFTPPAGSTTPVQVGIRLFGASTNATLATGSNSSELTNCIVRLANNTEVRCDWTPTAASGPQTLTVTINPVGVTIVNVAATSAPPGTAQAAIAGASSPLAITQQVPATTTTTTVAPTTAPGTPTSAAGSPTSAAAPTQAAPLPATGGSNASAFIALVVLAVGAFLLIMTRKFRET